MGAVGWTGVRAYRKHLRRGLPMLAEASQSLREAYITVILSLVPEIVGE